MSIRSIYKSIDSKNQIIKLYDEQLTKLTKQYKDIYVSTTFGETHIIETGNPSKKPLLVFHGGNSTTAYNLLFCDFLLDDFRVFAVDTIGHPGKSAEVNLSSKNYDYGKWASEVIAELKFDEMSCFGSSFGAGIIAKLMCVAPDKVEKVVLLVPSGIKNAPAYKSMRMLFPMIMYWITHKKSWFVKCIMPMAITEGSINSDLLETAKCSIDHAKIKKMMPSDVSPEDIRKCKAPTFILAGEKDCLFPASKVIPQAKKMIPHCTTYHLKGRGHMHTLTKLEKQNIIDFLK